MNRTFIHIGVVVGFVSSLVTWLISDVIRLVRESDRNSKAVAQIGVLQERHLIMRAKFEKIESDFRSLEEAAGKRTGARWVSQIEQPLVELRETLDKMSDTLLSTYDDTVLDIVNDLFFEDGSRVFAELEAKIPAIEANMERIRLQIEHLPSETPTLRPVI